MSVWIALLDLYDVMVRECAISVCGMPPCYQNRRVKHAICEIALCAMGIDFESSLCSGVAYMSFFEALVCLPV